MSSYILNSRGTRSCKEAEPGDFTRGSGQLTVEPGIRTSVLTRDLAADIKAPYSYAETSGDELAARMAIGSGTRTPEVRNRNSA